MCSLASALKDHPRSPPKRRGTCQLAERQIRDHTRAQGTNYLAIRAEECAENAAQEPGPRSAGRCRIVNLNSAAATSRQPADKAPVPSTSTLPAKPAIANAAGVRTHSAHAPRLSYKGPPTSSTSSPHPGRYVTLVTSLIVSSFADAAGP